MNYTFLQNKNLNTDLPYLILIYLIRFFHLEGGGRKQNLLKKVIGISGHFQNGRYISSNDFGFNLPDGKVEEAKDVRGDYFSDAIQTGIHSQTPIRVTHSGILFVKSEAMEFNYLVHPLKTRHLKLFNKSCDFLATLAFYTCLGIGIIMNSFLIVVNIFLNKTFPKLKTFNN